MNSLIPDISVIIPTYNRDEFVTKAVDSVLSQSYTSYELIVVDDGSTDNTREVLKPYMDRISYIYQENAGVSAARNAGIMAASGRWIAFLDSDDTWMPDKLARQIQCLGNQGVKVCFTNYKLSTDQDSVQDIHRIPRKCSFDEKKYSDALELVIAGPIELFVQTMLVARRSLEQAGFFRVY